MAEAGGIEKMRKDFRVVSFLILPYSDIRTNCSASAGLYRVRFLYREAHRLLYHICKLKVFIRGSPVIFFLPEFHENKNVG